MSWVSSKIKKKRHGTSRPSGTSPPNNMITDQRVFSKTQEPQNHTNLEANAPKTPKTRSGSLLAPFPVTVRPGAAQVQRSPRTPSACNLARGTARDTLNSALGTRWLEGSGELGQLWGAVDAQVWKEFHQKNPRSVGFWGDFHKWNPLVHLVSSSTTPLDLDANTKLFGWCLRRTFFEKYICME